MSATTPDVLICAGLDPSGGAGLLADASVVRALAARPVGVVTALTVQDTQGMRSCHPVDPEVLGEQLAALLSDVEVRAVKLGLLGAAAIAPQLGAALALTAAPVVWDPVAGPTSGDVRFGRALFDDALRALGPHLTLITPNTRELELLTGTEVATLTDAVVAAEQLAARTQVAVLVKGGHLGTDEAVDVLVDAGTVEHLRTPRIAAPDIHGTGCALSSAIAAHLAHGRALLEACRLAKDFVAQRIADPVRPGRGAPAVV